MWSKRGIAIPSGDEAYHFCSPVSVAGCSSLSCLKMTNEKLPREGEATGAANVVCLDSNRTYTVVEVPVIPT